MFSVLLFPDVFVVTNKTGCGCVCGCVWVCDLETLAVRRPRPQLGCCVTEKNVSKNPFKTPINYEIYWIIFKMNT